MFRVAIVLDPYPTRGAESFLVLQGVEAVRTAGSLFGAGYEVAVIGSPVLLDELRRRTETFNQFFSGTEETLDYFNNSLGDWDEEAITRWRSIGSGEVTAIHAYKAWLTSVLEQDFEYDIAFVWGNNHSLITASHSLRPTFGVEMGPMRAPFPDLVTFAYGRSPCLAGIADSTSEDLSNALQSLDSIASQGLIANICGKPELFEDAEGAWSDDIAELLGSEFWRRRLLFSGQLWDDSNSTTWWNVEEQVIKSLVDKTRAARVQLIIKPHPSVNTIEANESHWQHLRTIWRDEPHVIELPDDFPAALNPSLLASVNGVVAGNSSVLFESLFFDKPVHNFGAVYFAPKDGFLDLDAVVTGNFDHSRYFRKLEKVRGAILGSFTSLLSQYRSGHLIRDLAERYGIGRRASTNNSVLEQGSRPLKATSVPLAQQGVFTGRAVVGDDNTLSLNLADGRQFRVVAGRADGGIDICKLEGEKIHIEGWTVNKHSKSPSAFFILPLGLDKFLVTGSSVSRLDVVRQQHFEAARFSGFAFRLSIRDVAGFDAEKFSLFAYTGNGQIERISVWPK